MKKGLMVLGFCFQIFCLFSCVTVNESVKTKKTTLDSVKSNILRLTELDASGGKTVLTTEHRVVDPNSEIIFDINQSALIEVLPSDTTKDGRRLTRRLKDLKRLLGAEVQGMEAISDAISSYNSLDSAGKRDSSWQRKLNDLGPLVGLIMEDNEWRQEFMSQVKEVFDIKAQYQTIFKTAAVLVNRLNDEIKDRAAKQGVFIQLGAWIQTKGGDSRPIHIPGFDDYEASPSYRVEQFQVVLTDEQKKEISELAALSSRANSEGLETALQARTMVKSVMVSIMDLPSIKQALKLEEDVNAFLSTNQTLVKEVKDLMVIISNELFLFKNHLIAKKEVYSSDHKEIKPGDLLLSFNDDIEQILLEVTKLDTNLKKSASHIQAHLLTMQGNTQAMATSLKNQSAGLGMLIKSDVTKIKTDISGLVQTILGFQQQSFDFQDKVRKLSTLSIPRQTRLDLEMTGSRDIGDRLVIKLVAGRPAEKLVELDYRSYSLFFCTPYVRTAVSFLFTDPKPLFEQSTGKSLFYYAPSYSILLKGFWKSAEKSRKTLSYHRLFSPGLGLNISTLDFDGNGAVEIGMGGVFSYLNDFIQIGYGANLYDGKTYSFFGLKLPVGAFSMR